MVSLGSSLDCRILVQGVLPENMSGRLGELEVRVAPERHGGAATILTGRCADQAQLLGVLNALYELRLPILEVLTSPVRRRP